MPPSSESEALKELFLTFAANFPQDQNTFLERCVYDQVSTVAAEAPGVSYEDVVVAGRRCRWARPENASTKFAILFMHGGGYSFGSLESHRKLTAHLAKACGCAALSVDYRLTPEQRFPAAIDDCVAAYQHLLDSGFQHVILAGDSVGGGLVSSLPLVCLQRGLKMPTASVSLSPCYDQSSQEGGTMESNDKVDVLQTKEFCAMLSDRYCASMAEKSDPLVSALHMNDEDVKKMPPHWISAGGYDMLLDHAQRFAERLKKAGVDVVLDVHEGQQHVMEFMAGRAPEADESIRKIGAWVQKQMESPSR